MKKLLSLLLAGVLVLSLGTGALAVSAVKDVEIWYRGIRIVVDGCVIAPTDAAGKAVDPFILDGTTYLSVRAVASALGLIVGWDDASSTVTLDRGGVAVPGTPLPENEGSVAYVSYGVGVTIHYRDVRLVVDGAGVVPTDAAGKAVEPFILDGTTYLPVRAVANALGLTVGWDDASSTVTLATAAACLRVTERSDRIAADGTVEAGVPIVCDYDADGNLLRRAEGDTVETWTYANGRLVRQTDSALGAVTVYAYDSAGNLLSRSCTDSLSNTVEEVWTYDSAGRVTSYVYGFSDLSGSHQNRDTYEYDARGNLIRHVRYSEFGTESPILYEYDANDRLIRETTVYPDCSFVTVYEYDAAGQPTRVYDTEGSFERLYSYSTDSAGRRTVVCTEVTAPYNSRRVTTRVYDAREQLLSLTETANGVALSAVSYTYDDAGRVLTQVLTVGGSTERIENSYDARGNLVRCVSTKDGGSTGTCTYVYDSGDRLLSVEVLGSDGYHVRTTYAYAAL